MGQNATLCCVTVIFSTLLLRYGRIRFPDSPVSQLYSSYLMSRIRLKRHYLRETLCFRYRIVMMNHRQYCSFLSLGIFLSLSLFFFSQKLEGRSMTLIKPYVKRYCYSHLVIGSCIKIEKSMFVRRIL